ncbi:protein kinase domain-containing protein [Undibacterium sp. TC4M20W]|uniref:protein kinase domain-containing protein n=1 Tax=Undibacterium TaxID=401469 RepID=UPI003BEF9E66
MFKKNDLIDNKYVVEGLCSKSGGMGEILHVKHVKVFYEYDIVLKYCKGNSDEHLKRFKREVRLLSEFKNNSKIAQVVDSNLEYDPPYFIMKYYPNGDLLHHAINLRYSLVDQEKVFLQMIDCVQELHSRNKFHRDIKPQNFLVNGNQIVVSDFGLSTETGSHTAFTSSSNSWGTQGYIPPEFISGGFKHADAAGDVFMLGKTFYVLLTKNDPQHLFEEGIPAPIFHIIERCCRNIKTQRYQSLSELKQSIVAAYDVLLGRSEGVDTVKQLLMAIRDRSEQESKFLSKEIITFVEQLAIIEETDQIRICFEIHDKFFGVIKQKSVINSLPIFLSVYEKMVEDQSYSWSYAEDIANHMKTIFMGDDVPVVQKTLALDLAIRAARYMNRFAAMNTCKEMITSVVDQSLGLEVASLILTLDGTFVTSTEPSECKNRTVANALRQISDN